jgi:hypothetical protein
VKRNSSVARKVTTAQTNHAAMELKKQDSAPPPTNRDITNYLKHAQGYTVALKKDYQVFFVF